MQKQYKNYLMAWFLFIMATVVAPHIASTYFGVKHDTDVVHAGSVILGFVIGFISSNAGIIVADEIKKENQ